MKKLKFSLDKFLQPVARDDDDDSESTDLTKPSGIDDAAVPSVSKDNNNTQVAQGKGNECDLFEDKERSDDVSINPDPAKWPDKINDFVRTTLVKRGPPQKLTEAEAVVCPKDDLKRRFTTNHYCYKLCNRETVERKWLIYSKMNNAVFWFCYKLFSTAKITLSANGYNNWRNISEALSSHDKSPNRQESK